MTRFSILRLLSAGFSLSLRVQPLTANREIWFPSDPAIAGQSLRATVADPNKFEWYTPGSGSGSVSSVALSAPNIFSVSGSPITSSGTLALSLVNQNANLVFASPASGAAAAPTFRSLVSNDLPDLDAGKITTGVFAIARLPVGTGSGTVAAGNDPRFHSQNTDQSTTSASFQLDSGNAGVRIKNNAGVLEARNAADTAYVDIVVNNLVVRGTTTTIDSNTVNVGDNIINLNADYVGSAPTENAGFTVNRGTLAAANNIWDESTDKFKIGLAGSEKISARFDKQSFTAASLASGLLTVTHNLDEDRPVFQVWDNNGKPVYPEVSSVASNNYVLDFTGITITGTWTVTTIG